MKLHYRSGLKRIARNLRAAGNLAEAILWKELKAKKLGVQFLRQRPLGNYIVDFYCHALNLAIEVDGISHDSKIEADSIRQKTLEALGVRIIRFLDSDVRNNLDSVLREIKDEIRLILSKSEAIGYKIEVPQTYCGLRLEDSTTLLLASLKLRRSG